jgi:hypothetical protein
VGGTGAAFDRRGRRLTGGAGCMRSLTPPSQLTLMGASNAQVLVGSKTTGREETKANYQPTPRAASFPAISLASSAASRACTSRFDSL